MKKLFFLPFILFPVILFSQIPFEQMPSFETSPEGHYATGLGIADINNDGWKDIIVANGNDMQRQRLVVYYNQGDGTFPSLPDWQSNDIDYHGHLSAGDIDNDGDIDIAVSVYLGPNGFGHPGKVKIYYNNGEELEGTPSFQSQYFYTFSCALGDADADGDLDLAVACGEPYSQEYDYGRIFYNDNGTFNPVADWQSNIQMGALDVEFGDVDNNGYLDLIFVCEYTDNYVFLADNQGHIDENRDWYSENSLNFMNSVDFGRVSPSSSPCIVMTGNDQLGGDGKIKQFNFIHPIPQHSPPSWESNHVGYGSGILMAEINNDGINDLLFGSWWGPLTILEGCCDYWEPTPVYTASETSVVEAILMSDLGKFNYQSNSENIVPVAERGVFYLNHQIIERINSVFINNNYLDRSEYCFIELKNWISFKNHIMPNDLVTINYEFMQNGDIVISNWDPGKGNFIYYNTSNPVNISERTSPEYAFEIKGIYPQPAYDYIDLTIQNRDGRYLELQIHDLTGKKQGTWVTSGNEDQRINVSHLACGMYTLSITDGVFLSRKKVIIAR